MGYNDSALEMMKQHGIVLFSRLPRKFHARRNNNEVNSIEAGRIVIADLPPCSDLENYIYSTLF